jgi:hypothetical protein
MPGSREEGSGRSFVLGGIVVSMVATLAPFYLVAVLAERLLGREVARRSVRFVAVLDVALSAGGVQRVVFLPVAVAALLAAERRRSCSRVLFVELDEIAQRGHVAEVVHPRDDRPAVGVLARGREPIGVRRDRRCARLAERGDDVDALPGAREEDGRHDW